MTRSEFIEKIKYGSDIELTVDGKGYSIFTWTDVQLLRIKA